MFTYHTLMNYPLAYGKFGKSAGDIAQSCIRSMNRKYKTKCRLVSVVPNGETLYQLGKIADKMYIVTVTSRVRLSGYILRMTLLQREGVALNAPRED